jgi:hypothetical protein
VTQRPADAAAEIDGLHPGPKPELVAEVVLVARDRGAHGLARAAHREVERAAPAELVEVGDQVVELVRAHGVPRRHRFLGLRVRLRVRIEDCLDLVAPEPRRSRFAGGGLHRDGTW